MRGEAWITGTRALGAMALALSGCREVTDLDPAPAPVLEAVAAAARAGNVLSVLVTGRALHADSVAARYVAPGGTLDSVTPAVPPAGDRVELRRGR